MKILKVFFSTMAFGIMMSLSFQCNLDLSGIVGGGSNGGAFPTTTTSDICGDGTCGATESYATCAVDCPAPSASCGDGTCTSPETYASCPADCPAPSAYCGDGTCNNSETHASCPADCQRISPTITSLTISNVTATTAVVTISLTDSTGIGTVYLGVDNGSSGWAYYSTLNGNGSTSLTLSSTVTHAIASGMTIYPRAEVWDTSSNYGDYFYSSGTSTSNFTENSVDNGWVNTASTLPLNSGTVPAPAGDSFSTAIVYNAGTSTAPNKQTGSITTSSQVDYFSVSLTAGTTYIFSTQNCGGDTKMYLYNTSQTQVGYNDDYGLAYIGLCSQIEYTPSASGTYYVKIIPFTSGDVFNYPISIISSPNGAAWPPTFAGVLNIAAGYTPYNITAIQWYYISGASTGMTITVRLDTAYISGLNYSGAYTGDVIVAGYAINGELYFADDINYTDVIPGTADDIFIVIDPFYGTGPVGVQVTQP